MDYSMYCWPWTNTLPHSKSTTKVKSYQKLSTTWIYWTISDVINDMIHVKVCHLESPSSDYQSGSLEWNCPIRSLLRLKQGGSMTWWLNSKALESEVSGFHWVPYTQTGWLLTTSLNFLSLCCFPSITNEVNKSEAFLQICENYWRP